jgi:hypothetical protein
MKHLILQVLLFSSSAFSLIAGDIYQKGTWTLIPDNSFAQSVDWSRLFVANLPDPPMPPMRTRESIALAPDNTIYVIEYNNMTKGNLFRFDAGGKLQDSKLDTSGKMNAGVWAGHPEWAVVNDRNELWISEYGSLARCDMQGHVSARIKPDYPISDFLFLKNGALILSGWVVTNNPSSPIKDSILLRNPQTAKETILASFYQNPFSVPLQIKLKTGQGMVGGIVSIGMPSKIAKTFIASAPNGNLIAGYSGSPEILIFSPEGRKINGFKLPIERPILNAELKAQAVQRISRNLDSLAADKKAAPDEIERARDKLKDYPVELPYFSNLLADDQGNILVFLTDPDNSVKVEFMAFSQTGMLLGRCRVILPQDVSLRLDGRKQMIIRNGWLYALINKIVSGKKQVQLARFKIE